MVTKKMIVAIFGRISTCLLLTGKKRDKEGDSLIRGSLMEKEGKFNSRLANFPIIQTHRISF